MFFNALYTVIAYKKTLTKAKITLILCNFKVILCFVKVMLRAATVMLRSVQVMSCTAQVTLCIVKVILRAATVILRFIKVIFRSVQEILYSQTVFSVRASRIYTSPIGLPWASTGFSIWHLSPRVLARLGRSYVFGAPWTVSMSWLSVGLVWMTLDLESSAAAWSANTLTSEANGSGSTTRPI